MSAVFIHRSTSSMAPQHFLVVAFPGQGHINPARALAERLARATPGARVTLSAAVSAHRRMFPSLASPDDEVHDGAISYVPYSDGYDHGFSLFAGDGDEVERYTEAFGRVGRETFSAVLDRLAARGRPVTCVVYAMLMWWAAEVARERGLPRALYWIQPATMLAVYYHYFHGYEKVVTEHAAKPEFTVSMPGLVPMAIRDLPSFFTNLTDGRLVAAFGDIRRTFQQLDLDVCSSSGSAGGSRRAMVLVNTVEELEAGALASVPELDVFPVGPAVVSFSTDGEGAAAAVGDLFEHDEKGYMEWLDTKPARSVVYVSFGSMSAVTKRQKNELQRGLAASGMSYLWVVRNNNRDDGFDAAGDVRGMVVGWCDQVRVLSHPAVGCFVTHCGWNSTLEALACGAPVVAVPQWSDQDTNARLVVQWGIGVRAMTNVDRLLVAEELARCLVTIMGDREEGAVIRASSAAWKAKLRQAIADGGSSGRNLRTFLNKFANDA